MILADLLLDHRRRRPATQYTMLGERVGGLIAVAAGLAQILLGKHAPNWTLQYAFWGARTNARIWAEHHPLPPLVEPSYCEAHTVAFDEEVTCDQEAGHTGLHEGYLGTTWHWA